MTIHVDRVKESDEHYFLSVNLWRRCLRIDFRIPRAMIWYEWKLINWFDMVKELGISEVGFDLFAFKTYVSANAFSVDHWADEE